jgi:hypothetical protein
VEYGHPIRSDRLDPDDWSLQVEDTRGIEILRTKRGEGFRRSSEGLTATLDLTGRIAEFDLFVTEYLHPEGNDKFFVRERGTKEPWIAQRLWTWCSVGTKAGIRLDAILCPASSPAAQLVLAPGETRFSLPPAPTFELDVRAPTVPDGELGAFILLLERKEPLIDEVERFGFEDELPRDSWPLSAEQLDEMTLRRWKIALHPGKVRTEVPRLGKYVVVPYVWKKDLRKVYYPPIFLVAKTPGEVVRGTLSLE